MENKTKIIIGVFNKSDDIDFLKQKQDSIGSRIAFDMERDLLLFADRFKTRRVYCLEWTEDKGFRLDFCRKMFTYDDRRDAYYLARHYHRHVIFFDFKNLVNKPLDFIRSVPSPNRREAEELWKTFNTCCLCFSENNQCEDVIFRGKKDRMCKYCLQKIPMNFRTKSKRR